MRNTEDLRIGSNNEIEGRFFNEARRRSPDMLKEIAEQSRLSRSWNKPVTFEETSGPKINARDQLM
jgi:hypothetical protein